MDIDKTINVITELDQEIEKDNNQDNITDTNNIPGSNIENKPNTNNTRYNIQNLKSYNKTTNILTSDEAKSRGRAGGIKSGEARRKRKTAQELLKKILDTELKPDQVNEILGNADILLNGDNTAYNVLLVKMYQQAATGDTKAFIALRDTAGDQPVQRQEVTTELITDQDRKQIDKMRKQLMDISKIG